MVRIIRKAALKRQKRDVREKVEDFCKVFLSGKTHNCEDKKGPHDVVKKVKRISLLKIRRMWAAFSMKSRGPPD